MMDNYLLRALLFLIEVLFSLYTLALILRFLLQQMRADFYNPLSQLVIKLTNIPLQTLRKYIPDYFGIDLSLIILLILVQGIKLFLVTLIAMGQLPTLAGLLVLIIAHIIQYVLYIYIFIIFVQIIISWVSPGTYNPITTLIHQLTEPILRWARRWIPPAGGFDWSPLIVLIVINLLLILLVAPLMDLGGQLAGFPGHFLQ